jgi:hypothetical protein
MTMITKMTFRQAALASAAVAALLAAPSVANAGAYAVGSLDVTAFTVDVPNAFTSFFFNTQSTTTSFNGSVHTVQGQFTNDAIGGVGTTGTPQVTTVNPGSLDIALNCQGNCAPFSNNSFTAGVPGPLPNANGAYAAADAHMLNTSIRGADGPAAGHFGVMAIAQADPAGNSHAQTSASLSMKWDFSVATTTTLHFSWNELVSAASQITDSAITSLALATLHFTLDVGNCLSASSSSGVDSLDVGGGHCVDTAQAKTKPSSPNTSNGLPVNQNEFHSFSAVVGPGSGSLDFEFAASADAITNPIPEPMTLGLFGGGLLGLGLLRRRRQNAA